MTFWDYLDRHPVTTWAGGIALFVLVIIVALLIEGIVANRCRARIVEDNWHFTRILNPLTPEEAAKLLADLDRKRGAR